jgi:S1-C subfamily serine protease
MILRNLILSLLILLFSCNYDNDYENGLSLYRLGKKNKSIENLKEAEIIFSAIEKNSNSYDMAQFMKTQVTELIKEIEFKNKEKNIRIRDSLIVKSLKNIENEKHIQKKKSDSLNYVLDDLILKTKQFQASEDDWKKYFDAKQEIEYIEGIWVLDVALTSSTSFLKNSDLKEGENTFVFFKKNKKILAYNLFERIISEYEIEFENSADNNVLFTNISTGYDKINTKSFLHGYSLKHKFIFPVNTLKKRLNYNQRKEMSEFLNGNIKLLVENKFFKKYPATNIKKSNEFITSGSGILLNNLGLIITNYHVVENAKKINIQFNKSLIKYNANIYAKDVQNDLAILIIDDTKFEFTNEIPFNIINTKKEVGTEVFSLGYPMKDIMGNEIKFTDGKISANSGFQGDYRFYQSTTPINSGNSGGPLFDYKGNLIGINTSIIKSEIAENVSYSLKTKYLIDFLDDNRLEYNKSHINSLDRLTLEEKIKILSDYVVLINVE